MARAALVFLLCAVPVALAWNGRGSSYERLARGGSGDGSGPGRRDGDGRGDGSGFGRLARALLHKFADHDVEDHHQTWQEHSVPNFFSWFKMKKYFDGSHASSHLLMGDHDMHDMHDMHNMHDLHDMRGYWRQSWGPWSKPSPFFWRMFQQKHDALKQWYNLHDEHRYDDMHPHLDEHLYSHVNPHFDQHLYDHFNLHSNEHHYHDVHHDDEHRYHDDHHDDEHRYHDNHHDDAHRYHDDEHRYHDAAHAYRHEQFEKFQQFQRYMSAWEAHTKKVEAMRKMHAMAMMHAQAHKEQEFSTMMKSFAQKKKQYVFTVLFELMKFCKCKESIQNLNRFFNPSGMQSMGNMNNSDIMDIEGQLALLSPKSPEDAKKMFLKGLMQTLCVSAKTYVHHVKLLAAHHLALHFGLAGMNGMDSMGDKDSTYGNGGVGGNDGMNGGNGGQGDAQTTDNRQAVDNNRNGNSRSQNRNTDFGSATINGIPPRNMNFGFQNRNSN